MNPKTLTSLVCVVVALFARAGFCSTLVVTSVGLAPGQDTVVLNADEDLLFRGPNVIVSNPDPGVRKYLVVHARRDVILDLGTLLAVDDAWSVSIRAERNVLFRKDSSLTLAGSSVLLLQAGADPAGGLEVLEGVGSVTFQGTSVIQAAAGTIEIQAGGDVSLGGGSIRTVQGGAIRVAARAGTLSCGPAAVGYLFGIAGAGYDVNPNAGGVCTLAGGDITLQAGTDVLSLPSLATGGGAGLAGSGGLGAQPANVHVVAGGQVLGHYLLANGAGLIECGGNAGSNGRQLALSLVKGRWSVHAANDIFLQEVRNPNGIFNNRAGFSAVNRHRFDYDADSAVELQALHAISLTGTGLPRNPGEAIPPIFPPTVILAAGAGGIQCGMDLILYPSATGQLDVRTFDGGSVVAAPGVVKPMVTMSDSTHSRFEAPTYFGPADEARGIQHLNDPVPANLQIDGDFVGLALQLPKPVRIRIGGSLRDSSIAAQHFAESDVSEVLVRGDITQRGAWTFEALSLPPDLRVLADAIPPIDSIRNRFAYSWSSRQLAFHGRMTLQELDALSSLRVMQIDADGNPLRDQNGDLVLAPAEFLPAPVLQHLYGASQESADGFSSAVEVGGPGRVVVEARHLDLGATRGIVTVGPGRNSALAAVNPRGASIEVSLSGDLSMISSTIQSRAGGDIRVTAHGTIQVGDPDLVGSPLPSRGIFAAGEGNVDVVSQGDVRVGGSLIAAYSGGALRVVSERGDINVGEAGQGIVEVDRVLYDPVLARVSVSSVLTPGGGIRSTPLPGTDVVPGNIELRAPAGNIWIGVGGVAQISFNAVPARGSVVTISAGASSPDETGNLLLAGVAVLGSEIHMDAAGGIFGFRLGTSDGLANAQGGFDVLRSSPVVLQVDGAPQGWLEYQWFHDGVVIPQAMGSALSLPAVRKADAGLYSVMIGKGPNFLRIGLPIEVVPPVSLGILADPLTHVVRMRLVAVDGKGLESPDLGRLSLEASPDLLQWSPFASGWNPEPDGGYGIVVPTPPDPGQMFFRLR